MKLATGPYQTMELKWLIFDPDFVKPNPELGPEWEGKSFRYERMENSYLEFVFEFVLENSEK